MTSDPRRWMWAEACEMLARAERLGRKFLPRVTKPSGVAPILGRGVCRRKLRDSLLFWHRDRPLGREQPGPQAALCPVSGSGGASRALYRSSRRHKAARTRSTTRASTSTTGREPRLRNLRSSASGETSTPRFFTSVTR